MSKVGFIQRYLIIIDLIRNNRYIGTKELTDEVQRKVSYYDDTDSIGVSQRTIERDLRNIKENFYLGIEYSKAHKGYYIPEDQSAPSDFERILEPLNLLGSLFMDKSLPSFVLPERRKSKGSEHLSSLIHAIKNTLVTEFYYLKFDNTISHIRKVEPYALKEFKGRWYLLAMEINGRPEEKGEIKTWGLDRIRDLNVTNRKFSKNTQLTVEEEFKHSFGIYSDKDKPVEEVVLSFAPMGGRYNDAFPLHHSQKTLIDNDKEFIISLNVRITYDFIMELLSQSEDMKVIAPVHLRETIVEIHKRAIASLSDNHIVDDKVEDMSSDEVEDFYHDINLEHPVES